MTPLRRHIGLVFIIVGIALFSVPFITAVRRNMAQSSMLIENETNEFATLKSNIEADNPALVSENLQTRQKPLDKSDYNSGITISVPKLGLRAAVLNGTTPQLLKLGPGLYENSPTPDKENENVSIAAHRTTYGAWFRRIDELTEGDEIILEYLGVKYLYKVESKAIVDKKDWSVVKSQGYSTVTLTACHPLRSDAKRIVVRGQLIRKVFS